MGDMTSEEEARIKAGLQDLARQAMRKVDTDIRDDPDWRDVAPAPRRKRRRKYF